MQIIDSKLKEKIDRDHFDSEISKKFSETKTEIDRLSREIFNFDSIPDMSGTNNYTNNSLRMGEKVNSSLKLIEYLQTKSNETETKFIALNKKVFKPQQIVYFQ